MAALALWLPILTAHGERHLSNLTLSALAAQGVPLPQSSCHPGKVWDDATLRRELLDALTRIRSALIVSEPFPFMRVEPLFSACFYADLLRELPKREAYEREAYAGTAPVYAGVVVNASRVATFVQGTGRTVAVPSDCCASADGAHDHPKKTRHGCPCYHQQMQLHSRKSTTGLSLAQGRISEKHPLWLQAFRLVHSMDFTQLLVQRFSRNDAIPAWKQQHTRAAYQTAALKNTAALRIEPTEYHLSPHVDVWQKLVTWQFFHPANDDLAGRGMGTIFYRPAVDITMEDRKNPPWLNYDSCTPVLEQRVSPNAFFAFAPNDRSYHGAALDPSKWRGVRDRNARRTFLGFVTAPQDNFHHFQGHGDWSPDRFSI